MKNGLYEKKDINHLAKNLYITHIGQDEDEEHWWVSDNYRMFRLNKQEFEQFKAVWSMENAHRGVQLQDVTAGMRGLIKDAKRGGHDVEVTPFLYEAVDRKKKLKQFRVVFVEDVRLFFDHTVLGFVLDGNTVTISKPSFGGTYRVLRPDGQLICVFSGTNLTVENDLLVKSTAPLPNF